MARIIELKGVLKIHSELSSTNHIPLWAICRLLDKPNNPLCPDYDYAQLRILPAGTFNTKNRTLEVTLFYRQLVER
ncbi:MAG: hypothetical protein AB1643_02980 [Patescibacteria group bacterium]